MNIPARYCTGYLGDIGVPADPAPMDFSAWFEVFLAVDGLRWTRATTVLGSPNPDGSRTRCRRRRHLHQLSDAQLARSTVITEESCESASSLRETASGR